jgi:mannan endo-1,4-beta-mannosidase
MLSRRTVLMSAAAAAGCATSNVTRPQGAFVSVSGRQFRIGGAAYRYVGANMWYGAYLGADTPYGNRARLVRELDALAGIGVDNLRVLGSSELSPLKNSLDPAFRTRDATYNEDLLVGLDFALAEMAKRDMRAVIYLNNFWEWSGGMATYLYWTNGGSYVDMNDPAHPWPEFPDFSAQFYAKQEAVALYRDYVSTIVGRRNSVTGALYRDDPTIMSWQLANEPRPGGSDAFGRSNLPAFYAWTKETARLIKSLDANHLVSTGSEGLKGCIELEECVIAAHSEPEIDYLTAHIWPQNWSWIDPQNLAGTYANAEANTRDYITRHIAFAERLNKPLVIEEFGFPRDAGYEPGTPTTHKDRFYALIYDHVLASARAGGPLVGSNFWAWGGEARAAHADRRMQKGDVAYMGDPPHEPQGWYSVFDRDATTIEIIRGHAQSLKALDA